MIIALPTGIKIFSWINYSFSKRKLSYSDSISLIDRFPRSKIYMVSNLSNSKELVILGTNLISTINYPFYTNIIRHMIYLTPNIRSILAGILISDGRILKTKKGGIRIFIKQSIIQLPYLIFLLNKLSHYCPHYIFYKKEKYLNKYYDSYYFYTRTLPCLQEFKNFYNDKNKKIIPLNLFDYLNFEMLAHWIMCDGTRKNNALILQTDSYTIQEVVFIINILIIKFNLNCTIHYQRNNPVIYIKTRSINKIRDKIKPYMCESMLYKIENR
jgi:heme/copper-type cytochrome/quinol oxidase subunit 1